MIRNVQPNNNQPVNNNNNHKAVKIAATAAAGIAAVGGAAYLVKSGKGEAAYHAVAEKLQPVIAKATEKLAPVIEKVKTSNVYQKADGFVKKGIKAGQDFLNGAKFAEIKGEVVNIYTSVKEGIANSVEFFTNKTKFNPQFADKASKAAETFNNFVKKQV